MEALREQRESTIHTTREELYSAQEEVPLLTRSLVPFDFTSYAFSQGFWDFVFPVNSEYERKGVTGLDRRVAIFVKPNWDTLLATLL